MTWRENMGPGSFRGVAFYVESSEMSGGRRTVRHEFPLRDEPYSEDMGLRARDFPLQCYVIGDDYLTQKSALIAALETKGPGELIHPYYGALRVVCSGFRCTESSGQGGIAQFSISFEETPAQAPLPIARPDSAAQVSASASNARAAVGSEFLENYAPGTLTASAAAMIQSVAASLDSAQAARDMTVAEAAAMRRRIDDLTARASAIVQSGADTLAAVDDLLSAAPSVESALASYDHDPGPRPPGTTSTRVQERANFDALLALTRVLSVARAAELAVDAAFDSYEAAVAVRDAVAVRLDEQSEAVGDAAFAALAQLRSDLVRAVPGEDGDLPRIISAPVASTVPSLVLSHRLYGSVSGEADIVARNRLQRPGFIVGGSMLEVLSDG